MCVYECYIGVYTPTFFFNLRSEFHLMNPILVGKTLKIWHPWRAKKLKVELTDVLIINFWKKSLKFLSILEFYNSLFSV